MGWRMKGNKQQQDQQAEHWVQMLGYIIIVNLNHHCMLHQVFAFCPLVCVARMLILYMLYPPLLDTDVFQVLGSIGCSLNHPVTLTTRSIPFLVGTPYKPSFVTGILGGGLDQKHPQSFLSGKDRVNRLPLIRIPFLGPAEPVNFWRGGCTR